MSVGGPGCYWLTGGLAASNSEGWTVTTMAGNGWHRVTSRAVKGRERLAQRNHNKFNYSRLRQQLLLVLVSWALVTRGIIDRVGEEAIGSIDILT